MTNPTKPQPLADGATAEVTCKCGHAKRIHGHHGCYWKEIITSTSGRRKTSMCPCEVFEPAASAQAAPGECGQYNAEHSATCERPKGHAGAHRASIINSPVEVQWSLVAQASAPQDWMTYYREGYRRTLESECKLLQKLQHAEQRIARLEEIVLTLIEP